MRVKALFIIAMMLCILLCSCASQEQICCETLLFELLNVSGEDIEGNGYVFLHDSAENEIGYLSQENKILFYGENRVKQTFDKIEDYAIFVSTHTVGELAVFKCYSASDTDEVARMCLERADEIKVMLRKSEWKEKSENIRVMVHKKFVVMSFTEYVEKVEKGFKKRI